MGKPLVAIADTVFPSLEPAKAALARLDPELRLAKQPTAEAILEVARQADAVMVTYAKITGDMIRAFERCRSIGRFGIGVDNIDIDAATQAGIVVTYVPDYCVDEVSDHAMALLLALARKVTFGNRLVQAGRWEMPAVVPIHRLRGRTLGLVGFGKIPQLLAPKAQAFGLKVVAFDPFVSDQAVAGLDVELVDLDQLLARADFVSVHAPLTPETHHMFDRGAFARMKPEALLINTARGPLVDVQALAVALDAGQLAGAALDVLPEEPPPADLAVIDRDNVILTPHTAFYSEEALLDLQTKAAEDVARVLSGETPIYPVNPEVLETR
jgi:D-3-phosphoglycerate dehydrogenase